MRAWRMVSFGFYFGTGFLVSKAILSAIGAMVLLMLKTVIDAL